MKILYLSKYNKHILVKAHGKLLRYLLSKSYLSGWPLLDKIILREVDIRIFNSFAKALSMGDRD